MHHYKHQPIPTITQDDNGNDDERRDDSDPTPRRSEWLSSRTPRRATHQALYAMLGRELMNYNPMFVPEHMERTDPIASMRNMDIEEYANGVVHPVTNETLTKYHKVIESEELREAWMEAMCIELRQIAQGYKNTKGTNTVEFMSHEEIEDIPKDQTVTYARIVVDYRPQKDDPNRVRITIGGNLIDYPFELTTRTADLTTS